jgi:hypothetical protein
VSGLTASVENHSRSDEDAELVVDAIFDIVGLVEECPAIVDLGNQADATMKLITTPGCNMKLVSTFLFLRPVRQVALAER